MAKGKKTAFFCQNCGYESSKWMGQCPGCREWNTFVEEPAAISSKATVGIGNRNTGGTRSEPVQLSHIQIQEDDRVKTEIEELDRVLGGGIVPGERI